MSAVLVIEIKVMAQVTGVAMPLEWCGYDARLRIGFRVMRVFAPGGGRDGGWQLLARTPGPGHTVGGGGVRVGALGTSYASCR